MADSNGDHHQRHPRNLQGLLRFAMEATKSEDAPSESHFTEMDPERRKFLEEAIKSLTVNVAERLEQAVKTILHDDSSEDEVLDGLEVITDFVQDIDAANDFYKVGGFCILNKCLESQHNNVRCETLALVKDLAQNNPFCQEKLLEHGVLNKLIESLTDSSDQVSCAAMSAISAMVRAYEPALKAFLAVGGLECMLACIADDARVKLQIRVAFLISTIASEYPYLVPEFIKLNAIERIAAMTSVPSGGDLEDQNKMTRLEKFLLALCALSTIPEGVRRIRTGAVLEKVPVIAKAVQGREEFQEVSDSAKVLLARAQGDEDANKEEQDR